MVDAHDNVQRALLFHWRTDHHSLHALVQVSLEDRNRLHFAAGFDHQITARPIGVGNGLIGRYLDSFAVDDDAVALGISLVMPTTMYRVEIKQVRMRRRVTRWIVDLHEFKLWPAPGGSQRETTDPTETIDANFDRHVVVLRICCQ